MTIRSLAIVLVAGAVLVACGPKPAETAAPAPAPATDVAPAVAADTSMPAPAANEAAPAVDAASNTVPGSDPADPRGNPDRRAPATSTNTTAN
jgi:hypothetical protein